MARAVIVGTAQENLDGTFTYTYVVSNLTGNFPISAWSLEFDIVPTGLDWNGLDIAAGGSVMVPLGAATTFLDDWEAMFGTPTTGRSAQDFVAVGPNGEGDVMPGDSLAGFSFTSSAAPGFVNYLEFSSDGLSNRGLTIGPFAVGGVIIPEPAISVGLMVILLFSALLNRQRKSKMIH